MKPQIHTSQLKTDQAYQPIHRPSRLRVRSGIKAGFWLYYKQFSA
jgi:hypothetical protein